jgi:hypothetical protein
MGQTMGGGEGPNAGSGEGSGGGSSIFGSLLKNGMKGLGSGLQNYSQQQAMIQGRPGAMPQMGNTTPSISADYFLPQQRRGPNNLNFYGQSNG